MTTRKGSAMAEAEAAPCSQITPHSPVGPGPRAPPPPHHTRKVRDVPQHAALVATQQCKQCQGTARSRAGALLGPAHWSTSLV